jgi:hypothetical protein
MDHEVEVRDDIPPFEFKEFLRWVGELKKEIPKEYWGSAKVSIGSEMAYDQDYPTCHVTYERPETTEETYERESQAQHETVMREAFEREQYNKLKKKFEHT